MKTYVIADLHGMSDMLDRALYEIERDGAGERRRIVFTGDYIDRGPDGRGIIDTLRKGPVDPSESWIVLRGNHDQMMIDAVAGDKEMQGNWIVNGGYETLQQYMEDMQIDEKAMKVDADFLATLPFVFQDEDRIYVHAGLRPDVELDEQSEEDMLWIRDVFLKSDFDFGKMVVHGHTITDGFDVEIHPNRIALDTGACDEAGCLSVAVFVEGTREPVKIIEVSHPCLEGKISVVERILVKPAARPGLSGFRLRM